MGKKIIQILLEQSQILLVTIVHLGLLIATIQQRLK